MPANSAAQLDDRSLGWLRYLHRKATTAELPGMPLLQQIEERRRLQNPIFIASKQRLDADKKKQRLLIIMAPGLSGDPPEEEDLMAEKRSVYLAIRWFWTS